jgi:orotate phosphoribosyltransferase
VGGAFLAQMLAQEYGAGFLYSERSLAATGHSRYRIPTSLRAVVAGRRVLLVDDAISAGSALRSTLIDVQSLGGELVGLASLLVLGGSAQRLAELEGAPLIALASLESGLWKPEECPLCEAGVPLTSPPDASQAAGAGG